MNCLNANTTLLKQKNLTNNTVVLGFSLVQFSKFEIINHIYMYVVRISFGKVLER